MAIWKKLPGAGTEPVVGHNSVVIGAFDGVHRGHQALLAEARRRAGDGQVVAVTFDPHPAALFSQAPALLTSLPRRIQLLHHHGADHVRVLDFDAAMAALTPEGFIDEVLVDQCSVRNVVVGADFRFGSRASGTVETLRTAGISRNFAAVGLSLRGDGDVWSSTRIRALVAEGEMEAAEHLLGRPHGVEGTVSRGDQRGRELGYPTANVAAEAVFAIPPDGVYAGHLVRDVDGLPLPAAISIGTNPTFAGERSRRIETYVLDRDDLDLYDEAVRVDFQSRLRPMVAFEGVDELLAQMARDVELSRRVLRA